MKVTLTWHGKTKTYSGHLSLRQLVSGITLLSLLFIVSSRSTDSVYEDVARIKLAQQNVAEEQQALAAIQQSVTNQMQVYAAQLAQLKSTAQLLDSKSAHLAQSMALELPSLQGDEPTELNGVTTDMSFTGELHRMEKVLVQKQAELALLEKIYSGHHVDEQVTVSGRPVKWGWLSSHYGLRDDPFTGKPAMHRGIDFAGKANGDVIATGAGIITWAGERFGYGLLVEIDHGHGLVTRYGHNSALKVSVGDVVTKGQTVAAMGNTGRSTGVHVHYEVLKHGKQVDPLAYLQ